MIDGFKSRKGVEGGCVAAKADFADEKDKQKPTTKKSPPRRISQTNKNSRKYCTYPSSQDAFERRWNRISNPVGSKGGPGPVGVGAADDVGAAAADDEGDDASGVAPGFAAEKAIKSLRSRSWQ